MAAPVGFAGNEAVAAFRIRVGRQIGSAALVTDGYHARTDGWTSLAVLAGAVGVWPGYPLADPVEQACKDRLARPPDDHQDGRRYQEANDGVEPEAVEEIRHAARMAPDVEDVSEVKRGGWATDCTRK